MLCSRPKPLNAIAPVPGLPNAQRERPSRVAGSFFGLTRAGQKLTGLIMFVSDVDALGLPVAQGLYVTSSFYWDRDDATRAFARRFAALNGGRMPTKAHAATYAAVRHYLAAIDAAGTRTRPR